MLTLHIHQDRVQWDHREVVVMVHRHRHVMDQDVMDHHLDLHLLVEHLNDRRRRHYRRRVHHDRVDNIMTRNLILTTY
jgi:hypothetical protein